MRVPSKINLHLGVGPLRPDRYHELTTVYHAISLFDELTARAGDTLALTMEGEGAGTLALDETNLIIRAARALAARARVPAYARLHLRKSIPLAGGLAGGSPDAAATLIACDLLWGTGLSRDELPRSAPRSARTCRSCCTAAPRWAPGTARRSARSWPAPPPGTGFWLSTTAAW